MSIDLHTALLPGWLQTIGAVRGLVDRAEQHCTESGMAPADLIDARLIADMFPFSYQVKSCTVHSRIAIESCRTGTFSPDMSEPPNSFDALRAQLDSTMAYLQALTPAEMDDLIGRDVAFVIKERVLREFKAELFLLTFSQPNVYFHATTAYDILRMKGVKIGKTDFLGWSRPPQTGKG